MNRRRQQARWLLACCGLLLVACAGIGMPNSLTFSEAELQAQLAQRFPIQRSLLDAVDLQLSEPKLRLDAPANRLSTEVALQAGERRSGRRLQGRLLMSYALRFEAADGSIRLVKPRVESFEFDGLPPASARRGDVTQALVLNLAEQLLDDLVLYRVPAARLDMLRAIGYRPGTLKVTADGLEVTIEPVPAPTASAPTR